MTQMSQLDDTSTSSGAPPTTAPLTSNAEGGDSNTAPCASTPTSTLRVVSGSFSFQGNGEEHAQSNHVTQQNSVKAEAAPRLRRTLKEESEDETKTCPICTCPWTNSGDHHISSLRCGHLFGRSCIVKWLQKGDGRDHRRCPLCNKPAHRKHVQNTIVPSETDRLKKELHKVQLHVNRLEHELSHEHTKEQIHGKEIADLKQRLDEIVAENNAMQACQAPFVAVTSHGISKQDQHQSAPVVTPGDQFSIRFTLEHRLPVCGEGACRVMAYSSHLCRLVVSHGSFDCRPNGYGITQINTLTFQPSQFVSLHSKPIKDLAFHPRRRELLLSASKDCCVKVLNVTSVEVVHSYAVDSPPWSCCWDAEDPNVFYLGCKNAKVLQYDTRRPDGLVAQYCVPPGRAPALSLAAVPARTGHAKSLGGFVVCTMLSCWVYLRTKDSNICKKLSIDGSFTALRYHLGTRHLLVSSRPSENFTHARHLLFRFGKNLTKSEIVCDPLHTFQSGYAERFESRPCFLPVGNDTLVAFYQETSSVVAVWSASTGNRVLDIPTSELVVDLCPVTVSGIQYLATLSEKCVCVYRVYHQ